LSVPSPLPFLSWLRCGDISRVPIQLSGNHHHAEVTVTAHYKHVTIPLFFSRTESFLEYCRTWARVLNDRKTTICRMTHPVFLHIIYKGELLQSRVNEKELCENGTYGNNGYRFHCNWYHSAMEVSFPKKEEQPVNCTIWGSHSSLAEASWPLRWDNVSLSECFLTFWRSSHFHLRDQLLHHTVSNNVPFQGNIHTPEPSDTFPIWLANLIGHPLNIPCIQSVPGGMCQTLGGCSLC